ncbi:hypothetical protein TA3x_002890 [Tundrisphaera sp. TA3]|uniref:hypothetical protein n=1 Tax=Tundrisphaera sp. TA3 TaxID=3435775 RepID=UPI003EC04C1E
MSKLKRAPVGLIGMIALVLLAEGLLARNEIAFKTGWHWEWETNGRAARKKSPGFDILAFGDSQVNHGIIPRVMKQTTGSRTLNMAIGGGQTTTSYFQLRRAIESGARPKAVIVDSFPLLMNHSYVENESRFPNFLSFREALELAYEVKDPAFFARMACAKLLVSVRERDNIRTGVTTAFQGVFQTQRDEAAAQTRNRKLNAGGVVFNRNPTFDVGDLEVWYKLAFSNPEWITPYHKHYLKKFFALAAEHDVRVFWLAPPMLPLVQEKFTKEGQDQKFDRLAKAVLSRFPNVTLLDARHSGYPASAFVDHGHLDRIGAKTWTVNIGQAIERKIAGSTERWVKLPAYNPLDDDPTIEDISQSRQIVAEAVAKALVR